MVCPIIRGRSYVGETGKSMKAVELVSHHEQQASKCNGEQQHRKLWPAYNANVAPPQASTEGLFQQTPDFVSYSAITVGRVQKNRPDIGRLAICCDVMRE